MASIPFEELIAVIFVISDDWYKQQGKCTCSGLAPEFGGQPRGLQFYRTPSSSQREALGRRIEGGRVSKKETGEMILRSIRSEYRIFESPLTLR